jgi:hypothetical protein
MARCHLGSAGASMDQEQVQLFLASKALKKQTDLYGLMKLAPALKYLADEVGDDDFISVGANAAYDFNLTFEIGVNRFLDRWYLTYFRVCNYVVHGGDFSATAYERIVSHVTIAALMAEAKDVRQRWDSKKRLEFVQDAARRHVSAATLRAVLSTFQSEEELKTVDSAVAAVLRSARADADCIVASAHFGLEHNLARARAAIMDDLEEVDTDFGRRHILSWLWMSPCAEDVDYVRDLARAPGKTPELHKVAAELVGDVTATKFVSGSTQQEAVARLAQFLRADDSRSLYACYLAPQTRSYQEHVEAFSALGIYDAGRFAHRLEGIKLIHAANAAVIAKLANPNGLDTDTGVAWGPFRAYRVDGFEFGLRREGGRWDMNYVRWPLTISGPNDVGPFD